MGEISSKNPPACAVCHKRTKQECSHIQCPNRKRVSAQLSDGAVGIFGRESTYRANTKRGAE